MKIAQSSLALSARQQQSVHSRVGLRLHAVASDPARPLDATRLRQTAALQGASAAPPPPAQPTPRNAAAATRGPEPTPRQTATPSLPPRLQLLAQIIQAVTGQAVRVFDARTLQPQAESSQGPAASTSAGATSTTAVRMALELTRVETETRSVRIEGEIVSTDGQRLRFALALEMQRQSVQASRIDLGLAVAEAPPMKDPLVINLDGAAAQLGEGRMAFDLDGDGHTERVALLQGDRGFLALDRNRNGRIDDGGELFGARSGDGFAELSFLDADHNGWIDQADPVFAELRIWRPQDGAAPHLTGLREAGVAALSLSHVASPMALQDPTQRSLGQIRSTGVFLYEQGAVGNVQQVDLAVV
ncbi:MAG: hypothetical protein OHK0048_07680 [Rhodoferax sp.]